MVFEEIVERMKRKPYLLGMGSGKLSRYLKCSVDVYAGPRMLCGQAVVTMLLLALPRRCLRC